MAGGLERGQHLADHRNRVAGSSHRGRDRLGAEVCTAAARLELQEGSDGAELMRHVARGVKCPSTLLAPAHGLMVVAYSNF